MIYHIQKDSWSLDDPPTPAENDGLYHFSLVGEASDPVCKGPPLLSSGFSDDNHFFRQIILGVEKRLVPFQTCSREKSRFFNALQIFHFLREWFWTWEFE